MARGLSLKTLADLRRFVGRVANELYRDEIDTDKARALAYLSNVLKGIIESGDLEQRISRLERQAEEGTKE
ncbi:hypothetical protein [uncultured Desulfobacter sp.]|uniref:hypothetical protein n=1 Tax=uncultured Desulfobacter sp. TaxID=240139 RepID=UPI002AA6A58A|nr:hypothetical protein [uncultured Desulfobacter sp.]